MKKLLAAIALIPALAFAQSYPSPTYNVLTLQTPLALTSGGTGSATQAGALSNILGSSAVPVLNGGTGSTTASGARTNLGAASTGANTFTGGQTLSYANPLVTLSDTSGSGSAGIIFNTNVTNTWQLLKTPANDFAIRRYVSGSFVDNPISIANATGVASFTQRPVFNSATPWDSANLNFATPPAIGATTPSTGKFTTLQATSTITPSSTAGIVGTTTNDNANAGSVGEYVSSTVLVGSAVPLTTGVAANVTSISLTAGDWDVRGTVAFNPAGTTVGTYYAGAVNTTSATMPAIPGSGARADFLPVNTAGGTYDFPVGTTRISVASTTTVYLVAFAQFNTSTNAAYGFLAARRVR